MKMRFRIRTLLVVILLLALVVTVVLQRVQLNQATAEMQRQRAATIQTRMFLERAVQRFASTELQAQRQEQVPENDTPKMQSSEATNNGPSSEAESPNP
jgi:type II secretory pathway pseudopilin PulG